MYAEVSALANTIRGCASLFERQHQSQPHHPWSSLGVVETLYDDANDIVPAPLLAEVVETSEEFEPLEQSAKMVNTVIHARCLDLLDAFLVPRQRAHHFEIPIGQGSPDAVL